jgi:hypothetical protein
MLIESVWLLNYFTFIAQNGASLALKNNLLLVKIKKNSHASPKIYISDIGTSLDSIISFDYILDYKFEVFINR